MADNISAIIVTKNSSLRQLLDSYLQEIGCFDILDDFEDYSELYNTISSLVKVLLIVDFESVPNFLVGKYAQDIPGCKIMVIKEIVGI